MRFAVVRDFAAVFCDGSCVCVSVYELDLNLSWKRIKKNLTFNLYFTIKEKPRMNVATTSGQVFFFAAFQVFPVVQKPYIDFHR